MSEGFKGLRLYNTLTRAKEDFVPIDPENVRMYVCGPTVYDYAHIGNARPAIVFDVLYRLLRHLYGADHVTYVRNITDVDDKINARALRDWGAEIAAGTLSLNEAIRKVTEPTYEQYQKDVTALGCLQPTFQPRATEFVLPRADGKADMVTLIQSLIDRGHAYVSNGEVLFDVTSMTDYGRLSKRPLDEQQAGARIAVEAHKKNPADFVLWKESTADEPGWEAHFDLPGGGHVHIHGRPGWHIECSAMSAAYLGEVFDIHGGGLDLIFPHHENEIAQSRCAHGTEVMARYWLHNGFLQVEGRKMSKSEGNFVTIHELLETEKFGGRKWPGDVLRLTMLMTHYRQPIDFSLAALGEATSLIDDFYLGCWHSKPQDTHSDPSDEIIGILSDDLNTTELKGYLVSLSKSGAKNAIDSQKLANSLAFLGVFRDFQKEVSPQLAVAGIHYNATGSGAYLSSLNVAEWLRRVDYDLEKIQKIASGTDLYRYFNRRGQNWTEAGRLDDAQVRELNVRLARRLAFIASKNWAEADKIRDELLAQRIQLKDGKDPATGERTTTWEVKR